MNSIWNVNLEILQKYKELISFLEKDLKRDLTREEREIAFLKLMESKNIKPCGNTELNKEELIKEIASKGKSILNIDSEGYTFIKPKENDDDSN